MAALDVWGLGFRAYNAVGRRQFTAAAAVTGLEGCGPESMALPELPFGEWEMDPGDIEFLTDGQGRRVELGAGSFGTVYKARLSRVHDVAVKEFRRHHSRRQQLAVIMEVAILKSCHNPYIVQVCCWPIPAAAALRQDLFLTLLSDMSLIPSPLL